MMGRTHALTGLVAGLALTQLDPGLTAFDTITVAAVTAGAALFPDLDHPQSIAANAAGPITRIPAAAITTVSGGHRHGTHSIIGIVAVGALTGLVTVAASTAAGAVVLGLWVAFLAALGSAAVMGRSRAGMIGHLTAFLLIGGLAASSAALTPPPPILLILATMTGAATHIAGDLLTDEGCPLLWPAPPRLALGLVTTDGLVERLLIGPAAFLAAAALAYPQLSPTLLPETVDALSHLTEMLTTWSHQ